MKTAARRTIPPGYPPIDPPASGAPAARTNITRVAMNTTSLILELNDADTINNLPDKFFIFDLLFLYCVYRLCTEAGFKTGFKMVPKLLFDIPPFLKTQKQRVTSVNHDTTLLDADYFISD